MSPSIRRLSRILLPAVAAIVPLAGSAADAQEAATTRPNLVHVFADDLGWGSVGFNNPSTYIQTPTLDRLAAGGMILDRTYASTVCSPSRANLMTGFHNGHAANDRNGDIGDGLRAQDVTVGETMRDAGYATALFGKWGWGSEYGEQGAKWGAGRQIGRAADPRPSLDDDPAGDLPARQGYGTFAGFLDHLAAHDFYYDWIWQSGEDGETELVKNDGGPDGGPEYAQDLANRRAEAWLRDRAAEGVPFYLQLNYIAPHFDIDAVATAGPLVGLDGEAVDYADVPHYREQGLTEKQQHYAATISRMDASLGLIVARLDDPDGDGDTSDSVLNDTLILFSSDNGPTPEDESPVRDDRVTGGLKGGKRDLYEGGIRVPGFASWPGHVEAGTRTSLVNDLADLQATAAQLAGTSARVGIDGVSILPTLDPDGGWGPQRRRDNYLFENFESSNFGLPDTSWALIRGDDKLVALRGDDAGVELYDLAADPAEQRPLDLDEHRALVEELTALALAEGAGQPRTYDAEMREWTGDASSPWAVTGEPDADPGEMGELWSARVRNTGDEPAELSLVGDVSVLGLEVSGESQPQTLAVRPGTTTTGRNEVRVGDNGVLRLDGGAIASRRWVEVLKGGEIAGHGQIAGALYNAGTLSPAGGGFEGPPAIGQLDLDGDLHQRSGGALVVDLGEDGACDRLAVAGTATLGGVVTFRLADGYEPAAGDRFTFLVAGTVEGAFDEVRPPDGLGDGLSLSLTVAGGSVTALVQTATP